MATEEIFSAIAEHMLQGIMLHEQLANGYGFLTLKGYAKCHEYHYYEELCNYRCLYNYYLYHCNKMIKIGDVKPETIIDPSWYKYEREEVDTSTRRTAVRDFMQHWVEWEKSTKQLLEQSYKLLYDEGAIADAMFITCFIKDVDKELKTAENKYLFLEASGYDIANIIGEQHELYEKYRCKMINFWKEDDY